MIKGRNSSRPSTTRARFTTPAADEHKLIDGIVSFIHYTPESLLCEHVVANIRQAWSNITLATYICASHLENEQTQQARCIYSSARGSTRYCTYETIYHSEIQRPYLTQRYLHTYAVVMLQNSTRMKFTTFTCVNFIKYHFATLHKSIFKFTFRVPLCLLSPCHLNTSLLSTISHFAYAHNLILPLTVQLLPFSPIIIEEHYVIIYYCCMQNWPQQ